MGTFLVVNHGRSGSKWLARELNRSEQWTVVHEGDGRFRDRENYGEVNGYLRHKAEALPVDKLGVLTRNPLGIARSAYFKNPKRWEEFLFNLDADLRSLDTLLQRHDVIHIEFEQMVKDPVYVAHIAKLLGVFDLRQSQIDLSPCNSSKPGRLNANQQTQVERASGWFRRKWCLHS